MDIKQIISILGFKPKENVSGIFYKKYALCEDYSVEVDFEKEAILYGDIIKIDSKTTSNFSCPENFVVLECVDQLLDKGYQPQNIILEKAWSAGHGISKRLDICVTRDDGSEYMLIECKTFGKEFTKASNELHKDGGQLFTYFKFSNKPDLLVLYASHLKGDTIERKYEVVKIEDDYRNGDVKDFYEKWNKLTKDNGVFEYWVKPYNFKSKALTKKQLTAITQQDSSFIFNRFLEILRHNVVSDKGNAFNKIFTLFLCKVYDETSSKEDEELKFQWLEGVDDDVSFQLRLTDLYKNGMQKFLDRTVSDFDKEDFDRRCANVPDDAKEYLLNEVRKLRLEKNNEFAIKEIYDHDSFVENAKVVKEVVELLQKYRIRYNKRQQYLSDFFELLLTTGLKQEAGQFFTPVPLAQFLIKSLPLDDIVDRKLAQKDGEILPYMIDYAAGSGHFLTEYMHEVQSLIDKKTATDYIDTTKKKIKNWQEDHFDWATQYVYGIEKDYRLVKVGKVGCYLHGDGLANVILSDGLGNFVNTKEYKGKLKKREDDGSKDNQQFDILLSNPPYSVSSFKQTTRNYYTEEDFILYNNLTDNSSEIETLFIERMKQLLKDGGIAGIILPSSILTNSGIYTRAREIIFEYFEVISIAEFGSNTFMATGTNTVALFLRRRNNYDSINLKESVQKFFINQLDVTLNNIEKPFSKYVNYVWEGLLFADYLTLINREPNDNVIGHEIYQEYTKKIKSKNETEFWETLLKRELEKIFYFILAYPQKVILIKSGEKQSEKNFLGYEFSNRRGNEGIHPIQRGKSIDECTKMFDSSVYDNYNKASTYIYKAFKGDFSCPIAENLTEHVYRTNLIDLFTFDRLDFEKNLNLSNKKKVKYEDIWGTEKLMSLGEICNIKKGTSITKDKTTEGNIPVVAGGQDIAYYHNVSNRDGNVITISASGAYSGFINYFSVPIFASDCNTVESKDETLVSTKLIYEYLKVIQDEMYHLQRGQAQPHVYAEDIAKVKIPLPSKDSKIQIINKINDFDKKSDIIVRKIHDINTEINNLFIEANKLADTLYRLSDTDRFAVSIGKRVVTHDLISNGNIPVYSANVFEPFGFVDKLLIKDFSMPSILWGIDGDWMVNYMPPEQSFYPTDHCGILRVLDNNIIPKYFARLVYEAGVENGFSRQFRASIDRISGLSIKVPSFETQEIVVSKINNLENRIVDLEQELSLIPKQKEEILRKYL